MPSLAELDSPVRDFLASVRPLSRGVPEMDAIGRSLASFARDVDYLQHHIEAMPADRFASRELANTGPLDPVLLLVHRPEGVMSAVHSHSVWVALAPISGTETHRHYTVLSETPDGRAKLDVAEERHLDARTSDFATMTPPADVHAHGHVRGIGEAAYILVLTALPQVLFERRQYDPAAGTWQPIAVGAMQAEVRETPG